MTAEERNKQTTLASLFQGVVGEVCATFPGLVAGTPLEALNPDWESSLILQQMAGEFKNHFPTLAQETAFAIAPDDGMRPPRFIFPPDSSEEMMKDVRKNFMCVAAPAFYNSYAYRPTPTEPRSISVVRLLHPDDTRYTITEYPFAIDLKKERLKLPAIHKPAHAGFADLRHHTFLIGDHEIGHAIFMKDPYYQKAKTRFTLQYAEHLNECFADTYALLRHYARFGMDTAVDDAEILTRARLAAHADHDYAFTHMTAACLLSLRRMAQQKDVTKLTPPQAAELALKITKAYAARGKNGLHMENLASFDSDARLTGLKNDFAKYAYTMAEKAKNGDFSREVVRACIDGTRIFHEFSPQDYRALAAISRSLVQQQTNLTPPAP